MSLNLSATTPAAPVGKTNVVFQTDGLGNISAYVPTSGVGSVTSVGLTAPSSILSVSGSPITSSGTLALSLATQSANLVWAGPISGAAATPTFRALVTADLPSGTGTVTNFSAGTLSPIFSTSVATSTTTPALSFVLSNAAQNAFLAGPSSGGAGAPTYRAIVAADLPSLSGLVPWNGIANPTGNLSLTMGTDTSSFNYLSALAAAFTWANTTPTVTGASTTVALSTSTAPVNTSGSVWVYTLAASESGAGSNGWVNASVVISGYTGGATGNNGTFIITASTTTTITVTNASGTTTNTGTPVMISSGVSSSPILQIAGTVNTGTAGTLASVADIWSLQNVIVTVAPNPTSLLTFSHTGSSGSAAVSVPFLVVGSGTSPCSISSASAGLGYGIDITSGGIVEIIQNGVLLTEFNSGTTAIAVGSGACINWQSTTSPGNTTNTDLLLSRVTPSVLGIGSVSTLGNFGGSLVTTGLNSDGGLLLQQYTTVASAPTVTPSTSGSTSYSYKIVALDVNMHPIGASTAGTTAAAASTITTTNTIKVTWASVAGAFAYAVYRSASGGTPSTTGLLGTSQAVTAITVSGSTMVLACSSVTINADMAGQLITVSGSSHANNNGYFFCTAATATSITLFNPYAVAEASPPASAAFIGGVVPASTLSFTDFGYAANGVAAPTVNTSGSLGFVSPYESSATGTALSQDLWSIYPNVASGLNGASTLTFAHAGSSGFVSMQLADSGAAPTSAGTAGTAGQFAWHGALLYFCSVTGVAGSAHWNSVNLTAV